MPRRSGKASLGTQKQRVTEGGRKRKQRADWELSWTRRLAQQGAKTQMVKPQLEQGNGGSWKKGTERRDRIRKKGGRDKGPSVEKGARKRGLSRTTDRETKTKTTRKEKK